MPTGTEALSAPSAIRNYTADTAERALQHRTCQQRSTEGHTLRRCDCLNADDAKEIFRHGQQSPGTVAGHGNVVFLIGGCRRRIHRCRMCHLLVLRHQRSGRHLGDHKAGIQAGIAGKKGWQSRTERGINQQRDTALGDCADLADRQCRLVSRECHRFGMEISTGNNRAVSQHQWIVGDCVGFDCQGARHRAQQIETGTPNLWLAANAIRVLHALVPFQMAFADR
jgi:hypothetical protein